MTDYIIFLRTRTGRTIIIPLGSAPIALHSGGLLMVPGPDGPRVNVEDLEEFRLTTPIEAGAALLEEVRRLRLRAKEDRA